MRPLVIEVRNEIVIYARTRHRANLPLQRPRKRPTSRWRYPPPPAGVAAPYKVGAAVPRPDRSDRRTRKLLWSSHDPAFFSSIYTRSRHKRPRPSTILAISPIMAPHLKKGNAQWRRDLALYPRMVIAA